MRYFLLLISLFSALALSAQADKVYLKNGSLIKGDLLDVNANHVSIDIGDSESLSLSLKDLRFIRVKRKSTSLSAAELSAADSLNRVLRETRLFHQIRLGVINGEEGSTFNTVTNLSLDYTLFYPIQATWLLGVGIGFDQYASFNNMPIGIELRKNWGIGPNPFFTYIRGAISRSSFRYEVFDPSANIKGGEMIAIGIGQQWSLGKLALLITAGYRGQSLQTNAFRSSTDWNFNRLDFKLGVVF